MTDERSIAEIIGCYHVVLSHDWIEHIQWDKPTVDDMLAWLREHASEAMEIYTSDGGWVIDVYLLGRPICVSREAPTVHEAIAAAVRAVAEGGQT